MKFTLLIVPGVGQSNKKQPWGFIECVTNCQGETRPLIQCLPLVAKELRQQLIVLKNIEENTGGIFPPPFFLYSLCFPSN